MGTQLVVSLSGIRRPDLQRCAAFAEELDRRGVPLTLLLAPRPDHAERPLPDSPAVRWIRRRAHGGDVLALHGFDHRPLAERGLLPRLASSARHPTGAVRGAEFAVLPAHEAGLRLLAAKAATERLGFRFDVFVPPRWLASPGTLTALDRHGFAVCADALAVRELTTGRVHRARVHALGPGTRAEPWWARALVLGAGRSARRGRMVRLAVDSADLRRPVSRQAVLDAVDAALGHGLRPTTYAEFVGTEPIPRPRAEIAGAVLRNADPLCS